MIFSIKAQKLNRIINFKLNNQNNTLLPMYKLIASLLVSTTAAADWNYLQHGADWGPGCTDGQTN
jgi:hypothetical protein